MPQCIFIGPTRICTGSPYHVNGGPNRPFPALDNARQGARQPVHDAIDRLVFGDRVPPDEQRKLAKDLVDAVLAITWSENQTANAGDIHKSVQLMLVDEAGNMGGKFTLVAY